MNEYICWLVDPHYTREDTEQKFEALAADFAAMDFGEHWDMDDYPLSNGEVITVAVLERSNARPKYFRVQAEFNVDYLADECTKEEMIKCAGVAA